jgi:hypothetical protein
MSFPRQIKASFNLALMYPNASESDGVRIDMRAIVENEAQYRDVLRFIQRNHDACLSVIDEQYNPEIN